MARMSVTGGRHAALSCPAVEAQELASWAARHHLEPQAYAWLRAAGSPTARSLRSAALASAATNAAHFENLRRIEGAYRATGIPLVLLKGAALAESAYAEPGLRSMSDIDIWVRDADMNRAAELLEELAFVRCADSERRPATLQRMAGGEQRFRSAAGTRGLVELHWSAFPGWWLRRTACIDSAAVWRRAEPVAPGRHARRLSPEDALIQVALHIAGSKFEEAPLRGLMDVAVLAQGGPLRSDLLAERARAWRVAAAVWLVVDLAFRLFDVEGLGEVEARLRPSRLRRRLLHRLVDPAALLAGVGGAGYLRLLPLVDRPRDALRLVLRTLWPERRWLAARYTRPVGRLEHLWLMLREGEI